MRVDYDSEANALDIRLFEFDRYEYQEQVTTAIALSDSPTDAWRTSSSSIPPPTLIYSMSSPSAMTWTPGHCRLLPRQDLQRPTVL